MKAVILAGGKGTRLRPYTTHFPKPLMPIGDKPILEMVLSQLKAASIKDIIITTGHLAEMIQSFFGDGRKFGMHIEYTREDKPLGTAGPLNLLRDRLTEDFFVVNGDVLCDLNFSNMISFHQKNKNIATIGSAERSVFIDFGLVKLDNENNFTVWEEKPTLKHLVSMGIYLFSPKALDHLPDRTFFNIPDFIQRLHKSGGRVKGYVHRGYWLDIGRPEDYEKACNDFAEGH